MAGAPVWRCAAVVNGLLEGWQLSGILEAQNRIALQHRDALRGHQCGRQQLPAESRFRWRVAFGPAVRQPLV